MKVFKHIAAVLIVLLFDSCTQQQTLTEPEKRKVITAVIQMFENYHEDIKKEGLTAEFAYLDASSDFFWVPPGYNTPLSYDSVKHILKINDKQFEQFEFSWDTLQIYPLKHHIATYTGIVSGLTTDTSGIKASMKIIESGTLIKRGDGWKLLSGQSAVLKTENSGLTDPEPYFTAIIVSDFEASLKWYEEKLGFEVLNQMEFKERGFKQANLKRGNGLVELIETKTTVHPKDILAKKPKYTQMGGFFKFGFTISDFDKWISFLKESGVDFHGNIVSDKISGKRMVIIKDPDGNRIQLFED